MKYFSLLLPVLLLTACGEPSRVESEPVAAVVEAPAIIDAQGNVTVPSLAMNAESAVIALNTNTGAFFKIEIQEWDIISHPGSETNKRDAKIYAGGATEIKRQNLDEVRIVVPNIASERVGFKGPVLVENEFATLLRYETIDGEEKVTRVGSSLTHKDFATNLTSQGLIIELKDSIAPGVFVMNVPGLSNTYAIIDVTR